MKNFRIFFKITLIGLFLFSYIACEKDSFPTDESKIEIENQALRNNENRLIQESGNQRQKTGTFDDDLIDKITVSHGVLCFEDENHFRSVVQILDDKLDKYNENFVNKYNFLTDDELDEFEQEIGFSEFQPLIDFERKLSFNSRRNFIEEKIVEWLDNEVLDFERDPNDLDVLSETLRSLVNVEGDVLIGDKMVNLVRHDDFDFRGDGCRLWDAESLVNYYDNGSKRFKLTVAFMSGALGIWAKTEVISYRLNWRKKWRRYRADLFVRIHGDFSNFQCVNTVDFDALDAARRKKLRKVYWHWAPNPAWPVTGHRANSGAITGSTTVNGHTATITLGW